MKLEFKTKVLDSSTMPIIMGIHNATPDSFSDGNSYSSFDEAIKHCMTMIENGADIIDIGGESTRPGAQTVSEEEELSRILPIINYLRDKCSDVLISVDTIKSAVANACLKEGVDIINDISAATFSPNMPEIVSKYDAYLILMHNKIYSPGDYKYANLIDEVKLFLKNKADNFIKNGIEYSKIIIDPGVGGGFFGKNMEQSLELIAKIETFKELGYPVLLGASRKGFIGKVIGESIPNNRLVGDLAVASWAYLKKIDILRVHSVKETKQLFKMFSAIENQCPKKPNF